MEINVSQRPFGTLFEERAIKSSIDNTRVIYDEEEGLSVLIDEKGEKIPFVEVRNCDEAKTSTSVEKESSDEYDSRWISNATTKTRAEEEDTDFTLFDEPITLGAVTVTKAEEENGDIIGLY